MSFVEVAGNNPIHKFEKSGDVLQGILRGIREIQVKGRPATIADIETGQGKQESFWCSSVLKRKIVVVEIGKTVRVTYLGKIMKTPMGLAHDWKLEVRQ